MLFSPEGRESKDVIGSDHRIIELLELGKMILTGPSQLPCSEQGNLQLSQVVQRLIQCDLEYLKNGASSTFLGNLFQFC